MHHVLKWPETDIDKKKYLQQKINKNVNKNLGSPTGQSANIQNCGVKKNKGK